MFVDMEGDEVLVIVLNDIVLKDLLVIMCGFDGLWQFVVNMVVILDQFVCVVIFEICYCDQIYVVLYGMMNVVFYCDEDFIVEYFEVIGEIEGGYEVLVNYFGERDDELLVFVMLGEFFDDFNVECNFELWLIFYFSEKIDEIDEVLYEGNLIVSFWFKVLCLEIFDWDWMEIVWVLCYEFFDIFEQIVIILCDCLVNCIE